MVREHRMNSGSTRRPRRRSGIGPVYVTIGLFVVVLGAIIYATGPNSNGTAQQDVSTASTTDAPEQQPVAPVRAESKHSISEKHAIDETTAITAEAASVSQVDSPNTEDLQRTPAEKSEPVDTTASRAELVDTQLATGELGPAMETARSATDAAERSALMKKIAAVNWQVGEFDTALRSIRQIAVPTEREQAYRERSKAQSLSGGATVDFSELIELILQNTSGEWEDTADEGGSMREFLSGVQVDPRGVLYRLTSVEKKGRLAATGAQARKADLNEELAKPSALRLVSLTRLEQAVSRRLAEGQLVPETMKQLAGLSRIEYVFVYPDEGEIVIGGPAESWQVAADGIPVSTTSGRPTLQLDDLVTVLRTFAPGGTGAFQCLIVPRQENLKTVTEFVAESNAQGALKRGSVERWTEQLQDQLGLQDVVVNGVPLDSRVARVIVEADYRMKLIGIGKLDGGSEIPSYFDLLPQVLQKAPEQVNALRWWMTMKYESVLHSPDENVFSIEGSSVLCQSEDEFITDQGERVHTGKAEAPNRLFAEQFTKNFEQLAERDPVFADLHNVFDLALVAALIRHNRLDERVDWDHGAFASDGAYRPTQYDPAESVMSVVNHRVYNGRDVVVQVAGGVRADLMAVVKDGDTYRKSERLQGELDRGKAPELPTGRWWWDAKK